MCILRAGGARRIFKDEVFSNLVLSNNNEVGRLAADLCREMMKQSKSDVSQAANALIFATRMYQLFRVRCKNAFFFFFELFCKI